MQLTGGWCGCLFRDMDAAYAPYTRPPTGFDASRFPDRSGEGPAFQYGASMFAPAPAGFDASRFPDRCVVCVRRCYSQPV